MSLSCHQSCVWIDYVGDNATSRSAIQVKNGRKTVGIGEELDVIS